MIEITKDTIIGDILDVAPQTAPIFLSIGMHCLGCPSSRGETVEEACAVHGIDVDKLLELVNEVLDMGKLESGEVVLESVPFDLPELMHEITDVLEKQAAERGIVLHREYGKLPHPRLVGSPLHK